MSSVLVVNAGSSSIKLRLLGDDDEVLATSDLQADRRGFDEDGLRAFLHDRRPDLVGHRVVHGGERFTEAVLLDDDVVRALDYLTELAPLHQPAAVSGVRHVREVMPGVPSVACFDTTFHASLPPAASTYALPAAWRGRWPLRRFGFHGLSHAYIARRSAELMGTAGESLRVVSAHLGAGASLCAIAGGRSVDTTMGFTPLEGLVMATRSGSVDPGLVLWLIRQGGLSAAEVEEGLEHDSGLRGLTGEPDAAALVDEAGQPVSDIAALALDVMTHRLVAAISSMTAAMGGLDALVFTGGVGENHAALRARTAARLTFLGVAIGQAANVAASSDAELSAEGADVRTFVVAAREDLQIAREARAVLQS
ncbi:acetate/propionate family kinase [Angustibacter sp. McL0619]|uniref:acetate/propionate family kinase n=1 Tax=Angustibacter sp. McL0619 TaxID=3415676 RepID=UPI003CF241A6